MSAPKIEGMVNDTITKKSRLVVPLGFTMPYTPIDAVRDEDDEDASTSLSNETCPVMADVAIMPRRIPDPSIPASAHSICTDMRLSPHGCVPMDIAYVMTVYLQTSGIKHNILNLDFNGARDVGCVPVIAGKKHAWSSAVPSAIDDDDDEGEGGLDRDTKRTKVAMDAVA